MPDSGLAAWRWLLALQVLLVAVPLSRAHETSVSCYVGNEGMTETSEQQHTGSMCSARLLL
jgi:hypothetical protein